MPSEGRRRTWTDASGQQKSHSPAGVHQMISNRAQGLGVETPGMFHFKHFVEYGLDTSLFLLDLSPCVFNNIPDFYHSVLSVWSLYKKKRVVCPASLYWLLNEPMVSVGCFSRHSTTSTDWKRVCSSKDVLQWF